MQKIVGPDANRSNALPAAKNALDDLATALDLFSGHWNDCRMVTLHCGELIRGLLPKPIDPGRPLPAHADRECMAARHIARD
jgi:hypothetical protein